MIVIELTPTRGGEREGAKSKIGLCSGISMVQVTGESKVLSTDIDLDTFPRFPGTCAFNII